METRARFRFGLVLGLAGSLLLFSGRGFAQDPTARTTVFGARLLDGVTLPAASPVIRNIGQCMHVILVIFPKAAATVTGIQVRVEASYDNLVYFPISPDVTKADLLGGVVYAIEKAYGPFPFFRVRSLLATPGAQPMTVHYAGHVLPVVPVIAETLDRFVL